MSARANHRLLLENILRSALIERQFVLYFQPQVDVKAQRLVGAEALIRLNHPEQGLLMPADYIGAAEETGLIINIDKWVLNQACQQAVLWQKQFPNALKVAVNISVQTFLNGDLINLLENALTSSGLDANLLELEITENSFIEQDFVALKTMNAIKSMGISLAIDDFGTGYSSLSYLKRFPVDSLKIDKSFIRDVIIDKDDAAIVKAIIVMAHSLKLTIVAEGVETELQRQFIQEMGCQYMQGFLFAKPMPTEDFQKLLTREKNKLNTLI